MTSPEPVTGERSRGNSSNCQTDVTLDSKRYHTYAGHACRSFPAAANAVPIRPFELLPTAHLRADQMLPNLFF
jgi:hypothetical protein